MELALEFDEFEVAELGSMIVVPFPGDLLGPGTSSGVEQSNLCRSAMENALRHRRLPLPLTDDADDYLRQVRRQMQLGQTECALGLERGHGCWNALTAGRGACFDCQPTVCCVVSLAIASRCTLGTPFHCHISLLRPSSSASRLFPGPPGIPARRTF